MVWSGIKPCYNIAAMGKFKPLYDSLLNGLIFSNTWLPKIFGSECEVTQSFLTLCDPMDCSPPGSSVHGILQARILEWVAISFSRGSSQPRDRTWVSCIAGRRFILWAICTDSQKLNLQRKSWLKVALFTQDWWKSGWGWEVFSGTALSGHTPLPSPPHLHLDSGWTHLAAPSLATTHV